MSMSALLSFYGAILMGVSIFWGLLSFLFTRKMQYWSLCSGGCGIIICVVALIFPIHGEASSKDYGLAMLTGVCAVCFLIAFYSLRSLKGKHKARCREMEGMIMSGAIPAYTCNVRHVLGLPIPSGVPCQVIVHGKSIVIQSDASTYSIPTDRTISARVYPDTEMRQYMESSLGRTIMGGVAFGAAGAVIGAMPETKYRRSISKWNTMISYTAKDQTTQVIILADTKPMAELATAINKYASGQAHLTDTDPIEL